MKETTSDAGGEPVPDSPGPSGKAWCVDLGWVLSLLLVGLGMKLFLLQHCENPLPYFDQWEAEAGAVYVPYYEHQLGLSDLFRPQNEHRIFFTRIYDLGLLLLNGQWDSQLQMVVNAGLHCGTLAGYGWLMATLLGRRCWPFIWLLMAVALALPFGWENTMCGFQSVFYFLLLFSLLTLRLLGTGAPLSPRWRLGVLAGIAALFTLASGMLAAAAVAALTVVEILRQPRSWRPRLPTLAVCAGLAVAGVLLKGKDLNEHSWHAQSLAEFLRALGNNLSWPTGLWPWYAPFNLAPLLLLGWVYLRAREEPLPAEQMILLTGLWVILQGLATAYARGFGGAPPNWRYMDISIFLFIVNGFSILLLLGRHRKRLRLVPVWCAVFAVWAVVAGSSLLTLNERAWQVVIPYWARQQAIRLELLRAFMATDDEQVFAGHDTPDLPWNYLRELVFLLRTSDIRDILPADARDALKVVPKENAGAAFSRNGCELARADPPTEISWGSYSRTNSTARGTLESAPIRRSALPYLEIPVAGGLGEPGLSLELVELATGRTTPVRPPRRAGGHWLNAYVKAPRGEFKLVARDESATGWFGFKEPREMGRLSYCAMRLVAAGNYVIVAGLVCLAGTLAAFLVQRQKAGFVRSRRAGQAEHVGTAGIT
jgi:hypothetical protein